MNFSTNQVLHFYVNDAAINSVVKVGNKYADNTFSLEITDGTKTVLRSDKIENVLWVKKATAAKQRTPYMEATLQFDATVNGGNPVAGENYIVTVAYPSIGGVGIEGFTTKVATAYASVGATTKAIVAELAKNLNAAFEADGVLVATIEGEGKTTLVITQTDIAEKFYERGVRPVTIADFNVIAAPVIEDGEEVNWLKTTIAKSDKGVKGSYKLADMEYFALGERGDEYRMMGYPNYVKTTYRIDLAKEYDVYNIHYAYKGSNDQSHKSEKDLIIAVPTGDDNTITGLDTALSALGVTLKVVQ